MKLVAVIDLLDGQVVHARRGDRATYTPLKSALCKGSDPSEIAHALMTLHSFDAIYVADLNAIQRRGHNLAGLRSIANAARTTDLWIDAGISAMGDIDALRAEGYASFVVGSESIQDCELLRQLRSQGHDFVLSLDFRHSRFLGPKQLLNAPDLWPTRVLAMNLDFVGSALGPDLPLIHKLHNAAPKSLVFASGGLRNDADLDAAKLAGASGALLATSIHDGSLSAYFTRLNGKGSL